MCRWYKFGYSFRKNEGDLICFVNAGTYETEDDHFKKAGFVILWFHVGVGASCARDGNVVWGQLILCALVVTTEGGYS